MKAAVLEDNKFVIKEVETPALEKYKTGAIVKVIGCGLCGSDIVKIRSSIAKNGDVLGHEVVGEIVDINSDTTFSKGAKIVLGHHVPCFNCVYCWGENYSMCRHFKSTNIRPGGFSEYIYVSEEHLKNTVFNVNLNITDIEASFMEPLACCIRAIKRADIKDGAKCLVVGLGSVGILMGAALRAFGFKPYGCDLIEQRTQLALEYGFEKTFVTKNHEDSISLMKKHTGVGFDVIFLTAGAAKPLDLAMKSARDGAKIVVFSSVNGNYGFFNNDIYYRELTVMGSYSPSPMDLEDSIHFIEQKKVKVAGLSSVYSIENLNEAVQDTLSNKIMKAFIKL